MTKFTRFFTILIFTSLLFSTAFAASADKMKKDFAAKAKVEISTVSGDCILQAGKSSKILVEVEYDVEPPESFKPDFRIKSNTLAIKEKWRGRSSSGKVTWIITVPAKTEVEFTTASGDITISGIKNKIDISTASGDITLEDCQGKMDCSTASGDINADDISGELDFSTASGDMEIRQCNGEFDLSCASGDIEAKALTVTSGSEFSTASGDIDITLAASPKDDIEISAASGDISLDYDSSKMEGYFELSTRQRKGRIRADIDFDKETEYERNGRTYVKKTVQMGSRKNAVYMETASGSISLKK